MHVVIHTVCSVIIKRKAMKNSVALQRQIAQGGRLEENTKKRRVLGANHAGQNKTRERGRLECGRGSVRGRDVLPMTTFDF